MARTNNLSNFLSDIADAIRRKTKKSDTITPSNFDNEIDSIITDYETKTVKSTTSSQTINPTSGKLINQIIVSPIELETKNVVPSLSAQTITPTSGKDGISQVNVSAIDTETKTVKSTTSSQTITPTSGKLIKEIIVSPIDLETKSITPSTSSQTIIPTSGKDGISQITVSAVDSTIDSNIAAGNIKNGVEILGVEGTVVELNAQSKSVTPSTSQQVITPDSGYNAIDEITVSAIQTEQKTVKSTTSAQTITPTSGTFVDEITVNPIVLETKSVTPTTSAQTINPTSGKDGISQISVSAVTSSIDNNIQAGNIKSGIEILGVSGSVTELKGQTKSVTPSTSSQTITPDTNYNGLTEVTVSAIETETKTVKSTTSSQTITPTSGRFINEITVSPLDLETKSVTPITSSQTITPTSGKDGISEITVSAVTSAIDNNIVAGNIKSGVEILGVTGSYSGTDTSDADAVAVNIRSGKTAYVQDSKITGTLPVLTYESNPSNPSDYNYQFIPSSNTAYTYKKNNINYLVGNQRITTDNEPDSWMFEGNRKMKLGIAFNNVASALEITSSKIKQGVTIAGVTGNVVPVNNESNRTVVPSVSQQIITPASGKTGLAKVTVDAVTSSIDSNITAANIKSGVSILGVNGSLEVPNLPNFQELCSYDSSTAVGYMESLAGTLSTLQANYSNMISQNNGQCNNFYQQRILPYYNYVSDKVIPIFPSMFDSYDCTNFTNMFYGWTNLTDVGKIDMISATSWQNMFSGCTNLSESACLTICDNFTAIDPNSVPSSQLSLSYAGITNSTIVNRITSTEVWTYLVDMGWTV